MRKNKIVSLLFTFAVIAVVQVFLGISANAATINGTTTNMRFEVLGGGFSYAPYELNVNPSGEYCTRDSSGLTFQLNDVASYYAINSVNFKVTAQSSGYSTSYTKTVPGSLSGSSSSVQFRFSSLPLCDNYTIEAYAADNYGNTYTWSKKVKRDKNVPTIDGLTIMSNDLAITASDGNLIVNDDVVVNFTVNDTSPLYSSWIKEVSLKVYDSTVAQPVKDVIITPNNPSNKNIGVCETDIPVVTFSNIEKTLTLYITVTDYANNERTVTKTFYYDGRFVNGIILKGTSTASSVDCYFDAMPDISGVMYCKFVITTTLNGKQVICELYGTKVSANRWKITFDKTMLSSSTGIYKVYVWTMDNINNLGLLGELSHQF